MLDIGLSKIVFDQKWEDNDQEQTTKGDPGTAGQVLARFTGDRFVIDEEFGKLVKPMSHGTAPDNIVRIMKVRPTSLTKTHWAFNYLLLQEPCQDYLIVNLPNRQAQRAHKPDLH